MKYRFVKEYANQKKRDIKEKVLDVHAREEKLKMVDRIVTQWKRSMITLDEAMRSIAEV